MFKPEPATVVTWELEEVPEGTRVTLTHSGWTTAHTKPERIANGWREILALLRSELETGDIPLKTKVLYGIQGLWTAAHLKLPITYVIANNRSYRIIKERLVGFRKSDRFTGMDLRDPEVDFVSLAQSMGLAARRITRPEDISPALKEAMQLGKPTLLDVRVADGFGA